MRIRFVSRERVGEVHGNVEEGVQLTLFGFNGMNEVSYEKELKGESSFFEEAARLSKTEKNVVVSGCITDTRGHKRKSAVVAECGKLLGVSDALQVTDGVCASGAELRLYETKIGKMGVLVAEDLLEEKFAEALVLCGCDFLVCPYGKIVGELPSVLLRATAFRLGTPLFLCGKGYAMVADPKGELAFASPISPVQVEYLPRREYHLIERRKRGEFSTEL